MARSRIVKPEFFQHPELYDAERQTGLPLRLAFAGLWCHADREGRFKWKPRELKLGILPYDDVDFQAVLEALESHGFVLGYTLACPRTDLGEPKASLRYGWIPTFLRHQRPHPRETPSLIPPPPPEVIPRLALGEPRQTRDEVLPVVSVSVSNSNSVSNSVSEPASGTGAFGAPSGGLNGKLRIPMAEPPPDWTAAKERFKRAAADA